MIRYVLIALIASASGALAQTDRPMSLKTCNAALQAFADLSGRGDLEIEQRISANGWCQFDGNAIDGLDMDVIEWRGVGLENLIKHALMPTELTIRAHHDDMLRRFVKDIPANAPAIPADLRLDLLADPDNRQLLVRELGIIEPKGNRITLSGVFDNVDLSSSAATKASLLLATLNDVVVIGVGNRNLSRYIAPYLGATFPERSRKKTELSDKIGEWPDKNFPAATKRAANQLLAALPAPNGQMRVALVMGKGLAVSRLILGLMNGDASNLSGISSQLRNVVFNATWTPK